jgi:hypothetical protein
VLVIAEAPGVTAEQDQAIVEALNLESDPPLGARMRLAGPSDSGWRVVSLWDSRESFEAFRNQRLAPALEMAGRTIPTSIQVWPSESEIVCSTTAPAFESARPASVVPQESRVAVVSDRWQPGGCLG